MRILRKEVPELFHELFKLRVFTLFAFLNHLIECRHHVLHARHVFRGHVLHALRHLINNLLHHLLAQLVEHLFKALFCLLRFKVVTLQFTNKAGEILRHHVETEVAFHRCVSRCLSAAFIATCFSIAHSIFDSMAFFIHDVFQSISNFRVHTAKVAALFEFFLALTDAVHHFAKTFYAISVFVGHSFTH